MVLSEVVAQSRMRATLSGVAMSTSDRYRLSRRIDQR